MSHSFLSLWGHHPPIKPLEGRGNKWSKTHIAKVPHSPSTGRLASGSHWLGIPASHLHQEPGSGFWVRPASTEQLKDKAGRCRWHRLGTRSQVGSCVRVTPKYQPLSFTSRAMAQPSLRVAGSPSPWSRVGLLDFPNRLLKHGDTGTHLHLLPLSCQGTEWLKL